MFAIEHTGVQPDVVTMAKGIASGCRSACDRATSSHVVAARHAREHVRRQSRVVRGVAGDDQLLRDQLMKNAEVVGAHMLAGARALMEKHRIIGDVRGRGLMIGWSWCATVRPRSARRRSAMPSSAAASRRACSSSARAELDPPVAAPGADQRASRHRPQDPRPSAVCGWGLTRGQTPTTSVNFG
jgi:4-aminobutyrate aminotransferase-like enzyme